MSHWYDAEGKACHFMIGANGKERDTTLRDARKLNLFPSVTEILNVAAKPALTNWLVEQAMMAALTLPKNEGESLDDFKKRATKDSKEQALQARELGSAIHNDIELLYLGKEPLCHHDIAVRTQAKIAEYTGITEGWEAERTFSTPLGYGGMIDLSHKDGWIVDYKTKDFHDPKKAVAYDEHGMQLSAYAHGVGMPDARKINVFVSTTADLVVIHEWESDYFDRFECLLKYWQLSKGYKPS